MDKTKKAWLNLVFLVVTLVINTLGAVGVINGLTQKEISDKYLTLITPSPSTFSIWSVIYSLLLASVIVMILKKDDPYYSSALEKITPLYWISCLLNIAWIISFSYELVELSVLFILGFVVVLCLICQKLLSIRSGKKMAASVNLWPLYGLVNHRYGGEYRCSTCEAELERLWAVP